MIHKNILDMVGNTRVLDISDVAGNPNVQILAKLEGENPAGSIKDRPVKEMILAAIRDGELTRDKTIIEATSGNTGIALAMVGAVLGYKVLLVMSETASVERRQLMRAYGADIILTPGELRTDGAIMKTREMVAENPDKYYYPDQFSNPNNTLSHIQTANEIWEQTAGRVTHLIATVGTSGTMMGMGKRLRELNPDIKIIEAQPVPNHKIQGTKNMTESIVPSIYGEQFADHKIFVTDDDAFAMARDYAKKGLLLGMSSGAAIHATRETIKTIIKKDEKAVVVAILPDGGMKYLSTPLFETT